MEQVKNFTKPGGDETVINGTLIINGTFKVDESATVDGMAANPLQAATTAAIGGVKMAAAVADSEAEELNDLVTAFNGLLASLRAAGILAPSAAE